MIASLRARGLPCKHLHSCVLFAKNGPWLWVSDPFQVKRNTTKPANLNERDLQQIGRELATYVATGQPGAAAILSYSMPPSGRDWFVRRAKDAVGRAGLFARAVDWQFAVLAYEPVQTVN